VSAGRRDWDIIIVGGGPAGLAAAIYCGRSLRRTLVLEKGIFGGQIVTADVIENYPGFADPISPVELMDRFGRQVERYGARMENEEVTALRREGKLWRVETTDGAYSAPALIYAAGSQHRWFGVPGEKELAGRGVAVCATCDAPFYVGRRVAVLGGGDTALVEALYLTKFASEVTLIHRRDQLRAERILQQRAFASAKMRFVWNAEVLEFTGRERLEAVVFRDKKTGTIERLPFDGAFIAIGIVPNSALIKDFVELDENGYVIADITLRTKAAGLFVAGEMVKNNGRQVAISAGMGVRAALSCEEYLSSLP